MNTNVELPKLNVNFVFVNSCSNECLVTPLNHLELSQRNVSNQLYRNGKTFNFRAV